MMVDIEKLKEFFFTAALNSWVGKGKKTTIPDLPRAKVLIWENGEFRYVDLYYKADGGTESFGQTVIWSNRIPVWWMQYYGEYKEEDIPFLKKALCEAYSKRQFFGGRGPFEFHEGELIYRNHLESPSSFTEFKGWEEVKSERVWFHSGRHNYIGGLLLPSIVKP